MQANTSVTPNTILPTTPAQYPVAGVPNLLTGLGTLTKVTSNPTGLGKSARMESFSIAKMPNNTALVVYAAQDHTISPDVCPDKLQAAVDDALIATRIYLVAIGTSSAETVRSIRKATLVPNDQYTFFLDIDSSTYSSTVDSFLFVDGPFAGQEYYLTSADDKLGSNRIMIRYRECNTPLTGTDYCVEYLSYDRSGTTAPLSSTTSNLALISPLPFITIQGESVPAINPQVAVRRNDDDSSYPFYAMIVAEAPVQGVHQLFAYAAALDTDGSSPPDTMYWKQLTFDGENRNAKIAYDSTNSLHILWQSSRCGTTVNPEQLYYGVLGPWSRVTNNEVMASALNKQAQMLQGAQPDAGLTESLMQFGSPLALDLTPHAGGNMWTTSVSGGTASASSHTTVTVQGNSHNQLFMALTCLDRDASATPFGDLFSHRSYQVSFDLDVTFPSETLAGTDLQIEAKYKAFKTSQFAPVTGTSFFTKTLNQYTIGEIERTFGNVIPIVGSYKIPALKQHLIDGDASISTNEVSLESSTMQLRHFMFGMMPEKVTFRATNTQTEAEFLIDHPLGTYAAEVSQESFTGNFRFVLLMQTSANLGNSSAAASRYKIVREFGPTLRIGTTNNYTIAVHYTHLPLEAIAPIVTREISGIDADEVRFQGDIIVAVNDNVVVADTFLVNLADSYYRYDLGFGTPTGGQVVTGAMVPLDFGVYENVIAHMAFTNIAVGPHSMTFVPALLHATDFDRHVSTMEKPYSVDEWHSDNIYNELVMSEDAYSLTLGLKSSRVSLSQIPITFVGTNTAPSLCVDYCDRPHVAWQSNRDNQWEIYYTSGLNRVYPFLFDTRISNTASNSLSPSVSVDKNGRRVIVWHDDRTGHYQIYAAKSLVPSGCDLGFCQLQEVQDLDVLINMSSSSSLSSNSSSSSKSSSSSYVPPARNSNSSSSSSPSSNSSSSSSNSSLSSESSSSSSSHSSNSSSSIDSSSSSKSSSSSNRIAYSDSSLSSASSHSSNSEQPEDSCSLSFEFTNIYSLGNFHFRLSFYRDEAFTQLQKIIFSQDDISDWTFNGVQWPYNGVNMAVDQTGTVVYTPSGDDDLVDQILYVVVDIYDGSVFHPLLTNYAFFCARDQSPRCHIPIKYTNTGGSTVNAHLRVTFYTDAGMTDAAYSASTELDTRKWIANYTGFPSGGVSVPASGVATVAFDPDVLPLNMASRAADNAQAVLCNAQYFVKVEVDHGSGFASLTTLVFKCACADVQSDVWGQKASTFEWVCSGQGGTDLVVSQGGMDALFPTVASSPDGVAYLSWQDNRFGGMLTNQKGISPEIFAAVWDLRTDELFSSGQGSEDIRLATYAANTDRFYRPVVLIDGFMNPVFFFNNRYDVYTRSFGLSATPTSSTTHEYATIIPSTRPLIMSSDEIGTCIRMKVFKADVKATYYTVSNPLGPVDAVGKCFVRFEVDGPPGTRAVRMKNENDTAYSDWLPILPELPGDPTILSADEPLSQQSVEPEGAKFEAYMIGDDKFVVPWVLSNGSGPKLVCCQVLAYEGRTEDICINVLGAYDEFSYKIDFFYDVGMTSPLPTFNGMPVAGSLQPQTHPISATDPTSITDTRNPVTQIYIRVTFFDPDLLEDILSLNRVSSFDPSSPVFTFDMVGGGTTDLFNQTLTRASSGVYTGSFPLVASNGIETKEGLGVIKVNIPDPRLKSHPYKTTIVKLDNYNFMSSPLSRYADAFPTKAFSLTAEDIQAVDIQKAETSRVTSDEFRELYRPELTCTFLGRACSGTQPSDDHISSSVLHSSGNDNLPSTSSLWPTPTCGKFSWFVPQVTEPFYYKFQPNPETYMRESEPFYLSMDDPAIEGVRFGDQTDWDGILLMIKGNESVSQIWSGALGSTVRFVIPPNSIFLSRSALLEPLRSGFFAGAESFRHATAPKVLAMASSNYSLAAGTGDGGNMTSFSPAPTTHDYSQGIALDVLRENGFVSADDVFSCKFVHITCGISHCVIDGFTCGHVLTTYNVSSSSSSFLDHVSISSISSISDLSLCRTTCVDCCQTYYIILSGSSGFDGLYTFRRNADYCIWNGVGTDDGTFIALSGTRWVLSISSGTDSVIFTADSCTTCPPLHSANWTLVYSRVGRPEITLSETLCEGSVSGDPGTSSGNPLFCNFKQYVAGVADYNNLFDISEVFGGDSTKVVPFTFVYNTYTFADRFIVSNASELTTHYDSGCVATNGEITAIVSLKLADSPIRVQMLHACASSLSAGDGWFWSATCSSVTCGTFDTTFVWTTGYIGEPFYFTYRSNEPTFSRESSPFSLDMSSPALWGLQFAPGSALDDVLVMMKPGESIIETWSGIQNDPVSLVLPFNCILFYPTGGFFINGPASNGTHNKSHQKTISEAGTSHVVVIPAGLDDNSTTGQGNGSTLIAGGFDVVAFPDGVSKADLVARGFIDGDGILSCKFGHIVCGAGDVEILGLTCTTSPSIITECSVPPTPGTLVVSLSGGDISLTWSDTSGGVASFVIERSFGISGDMIPIDGTSPGVTTYTDVYGGASPDGYCYQVFATTPCGRSSAGNIACYFDTSSSSSVGGIVESSSSSNGTSSSSFSSSSSSDFGHDGCCLIPPLACSTVTFNISASSCTPPAATVETPGYFPSKDVELNWIQGYAGWFGGDPGDPDTGWYASMPCTAGTGVWSLHLPCSCGEPVFTYAGGCGSSVPSTNPSDWVKNPSCSLNNVTINSITLSDCSSLIPCPASGDTNSYQTIAPAWTQATYFGNPVAVNGGGITDVIMSPTGNDCSLNLGSWEGSDITSSMFGSIFYVGGAAGSAHWVLKISDGVHPSYYKAYDVSNGPGGPGGTGLVYTTDEAATLPTTMTVIQV